MKKEFRVGLFAQDIVPGKILNLLAYELRIRGISCITNFGEARKEEIGSDPKQIERIVRGSKIVGIGMSSSPELAKGEILAARSALRNDVPFFLCTDTWNCIHRSWFGDIVSEASLAFVVSDAEKERAHSLYDNPKQVSTSGSPLWEASRYVKYNRETIRATLKLNDGNIALLCPLSKVFGVNKELLTALEILTRKLNAVGFVSYHPFDETDRSAYQALVPEGQFRTFSESTQEILPGMDLLLNGGGSMGINAVNQDIPVLEVRGTAILEEIDRIFSGYYGLPIEAPELVKEASGNKLFEVAQELLAHKSKWNGIVGEPPKPSLATIKMADTVSHFLETL